MANYVKLFGSILDSTIWRESKATRLVWITLLAMADKEGVVYSSLVGLADRAKVEMDECKEALEVLRNPDEMAREQEHEGRRIQPVPGGWFLLNHAKYRALQSAEDLKAKAAQRQAKFRAKRKEREMTKEEKAAIVRAENAHQEYQNKHVATPAPMLPYE